ncbi:HAD family hydrolase [Streptomyces sp. DH37]|uniref:HAD family hydrolase n=1 Tax=Streptomyces sp. DH37 TaxID=3040122 RepID=UPI002442BA56|nr:HAD hydrolase family protein [Streptomyces sp. DH37]MDG9701966.1 HAD hydrolase family protein [Streptomyces sp. DH37]
MHPARVPSLIVASDLDGTLLTTDQRITPRTRRAVALLHEAGGLFAVVTARPLRDAAHIARDVSADLLLCGGGAVLYDPAAGRVLDVTAFPAGSARRLVAEARRGVPDVRIGVEYGDRCELDPGFSMGSPGVADTASDRPVTVTDEPVLKIVMQSGSLDADALARRADRLLRSGAPPGAPRHVVTVSCRFFAEVLPAGVHKAGHLSRLCAGRAARARTVAFGDMPNDLALFEWADTRVAVANAHPDVLAACHRVTDSNDEDGVAVFLEQMLADRLPRSG